MAEFRMFRAIRPKKSKASKIAALPYDVYNRNEAKKIVIENPDSFLAIDRAETFFDDSVSAYDSKVYEKANEEIERRIRCGDFIQDELPMYYIYALTMNNRTQHGIVACANIDDYLNHNIKKHENTREDKELDRTTHVDVCSMQTGPIFLAYQHDLFLKKTLNTEMKKTPEYDFTTEDEIRHQVWCIKESEMQKELSEHLKKLEHIYIADGHHRCASAVKVGLMRRKQHPNYTGEEEFNTFLTVLFPEDELMILDYNRVVKDLNGMSIQDFIKALSVNFIVEKVQNRNHAKPSMKGEMACYLNDTWYKISCRKHCYSENPVDNLDVSILQKYILDPLFAIKEPKTDKRIDFVGGIRGMQELEARCKQDCKVAFAMYPTNILELFAVADAGMLMPPKSTWFEPKLRSGLFLHKIER